MGMWKKLWKKLLSLFGRKGQETEKAGGRRIKELRIDMGPLQRLRFREAGAEVCRTREELDESRIRDVLQRLLDGELRWLAIEFQLQGEGIYVKRLKKIVYQPYETALVLHQSGGKFACLYFSGHTYRVYLSIGNEYPYYHVDSKELQRIPVGDVTLVEYGIHAAPEGVLEAVGEVLRDIPGAENRLYGPGRWSANNNGVGGGTNTYQKLRREWGLLE